MVPEKTGIATFAAAILIAVPSTGMGGTFTVPDWQTASDRLGVPLLAPTELAGHELAGIQVRTLSCFGRSVDYEVSATYRRPDGSEMSFSQGQPRTCGDGAGFDDLGTQVIGTRAVDFYSFVDAPGSCWGGPEAVCVNGGAQELLGVFREGGREHVLFANHGVQNSVVSLLNGLQTIQPLPGARPVVQLMQARIVAVLRPDRIRVRAEGRLRTVRLAGVAAPRPGQCGYQQALRYSKSFAKRGSTMVLEVDPLLRKGGVLPVGTLWRQNRVATTSLNGELVDRGYARPTSANSRYRVALVGSLGAARTDRKGIWGPLCTPRLRAPRPARAAPTRPTAPARPTPAAPGDIFNCDDFPLPDGTTANEYLRRYPSDPSRLDGDGDGRACE